MEGFLNLLEVRSIFIGVRMGPASKFRWLVPTRISVRSLSEEKTIIKKKKIHYVTSMSLQIKSRTEQLAARKETLRWALVYVDLGWSIIPLWSVDKNSKCLCHRKDCPSPGQHPHNRLAPSGIEDATKDREKVKLWFASNDLNIGILTGPESGLVVLDVDLKEGGNKSLTMLETRYGQFETIEAVTCDGGMHLVMQYPKGQRISNWINKLAPGLSVRGIGDYIVACPSRHANGRRYQWKDDPAVVELPLCPEWFVKAGMHSRAAQETINQIRKKI
jgi:hypothetical protein